MELNKIYQGDCLEVMKQIEDNSIDLVIIDPPYDLVNIEDLAILIKSKIKHNSSIWIFGNFKFIAEIKVTFSKYFKFNNWIIWIKGTRASSKKLLTSTHDDLLFFTNSGDYTFNLDNIRIPYDDSAIKWYKRYSGRYNYKKVFKLNENGKNPSDVWIFPFIQGKAKDSVKHPHQKPIGLIERIIKLSSNKNDLILDCFMGSGTTAIACIRTNRNYIGMELSEDYVKISNERIQKELSQSKLNLTEGKFFSFQP